MFRNIAAYKFVELAEDQLSDLRAAMKVKCSALELRGTILLAAEGINLMLAGRLDAITALKYWLDADHRFKGLDYKESDSDMLPFNRMLVRIKKEIIAFGVAGVRPEESSAPYVSSKEFKRWLDEGRTMTVLDTRNGYETKLGRFSRADTLGLDHFRQFPAASEQLDDLDKSEPIVTYCTGGIRCEKASALLMQRGFRNVYQLKGGILRYFEECGDAHYRGECFVYDQRVSVDSELRETGTVQCFNCLHPVSVEEQTLENYVPDVSCRYCVDGKWKNCDSHSALNQPVDSVGRSDETVA